MNQVIYSYAMGGLLSRTHTGNRKSSCSNLIKGNPSRTHPGKVQSPCYQFKYKINKQNKKPAK